MAQPELANGTTVYDAAAKKVGVVMDHFGSRYSLRSCEDGQEWGAWRSDLSAILSDVLRPAVAERNANSRTGL
ncbi:hypothetical protein ACH41E_02730 [Streptomyces sp. NPDC020412]|uniref:hypothetical protein n=1 Tax=Streptomyces sp. NPDC020412 TaxID=3365073 RepID=UPI0037B85CA4